MNGRDRILDRYNNGDLNGEEQVEFNRLLESDPELRQMFEADKLLTDTMLKDRTYLSGVDHSATYASFLSGLTGEIPSSPGTPAPAPSSPTSAPAFGWAGTFVGKMLLSSTVAAIVVLGVLTLQSDPDERPASQPAPAAVRTPSAAPVSAIPAPASPALAPSAAAQDRPVEVTTSSASERNMVRGTSATASRPDLPAQQSATGSGRNRDWSLTPSSNDLPVFKKDSIKVQMQQNP